MTFNITVVKTGQCFLSVQRWLINCTSRQVALKNASTKKKRFNLEIFGLVRRVE